MSVATLAYRPPSLKDLFWRTAFRFGFPLARLWWQVRRAPHEGALVAVYVGPMLLLVQSSYRAGWTFPGGGIRRDERPEAAARRELAEEIGLLVPSPRPAGIISGMFDSRPDRVHFFAVHLDRLPPLQLDNREITAAKLFPPDAVQHLRLTAPVATYLGRPPSRRHRPFAQERKAAMGDAEPTCGKGMP